MRKKKEKGFTLIELVVVVAILGVLAGVAVPRVLGVLQEARAKANESNLAQIQVAIERHIIASGNSAAGLAPLVSGTVSDGVFRAISWTEAGMLQYFGKQPVVPQGYNAYVISFSEIGVGSGRFNATVTNGTPTAP